MAILIALQIILTRFLSIFIFPWLRFSLGFLPIAAVGMLLGPIPAALCGALGDVLGFFLFPSGTFFPGYTLTAALTGLIYGLFLYGIHKEIHHGNRTAWLRLLLCELVIILFCYIGLNTLWSHILVGKAFFVLLPTRALKNIAQYPINVLLLMEMGILFRRLPSSLRPSV
jgi:ECF transporter S component (folate family)